MTFCTIAAPAPRLLADQQLGHLGRPSQNERSAELQDVRAQALSDNGVDDPAFQQSSVTLDMTFCTLLE